MRVWMLILPLLLTACSRPTEPEVPAEAAKQIDLFAQPWLARGNEPFWSVRIEGGRLKLERPDAADITADVETRGLTGDTATWLARSATGEVLALALVRKPCSDGMSDMGYAWSATLRLRTGELRGCAGPASELTKKATS